MLEYLESVNREQTVKMSGEDKASVAKALSDALAKPIWGTLTIKTNSLLARKTISGFRPYAHIPEVASMLAHLRSNSKVKVNSLELHYLRRRYLDGISLRDSAELNSYFEQCLRDPQALVYEQRSKDQVRYAVYSAQTGWVAFVEADGRRISVHPLRDDPNQLGRLLWRIQDLLP